MTQSDVMRIAKYCGIVGTKVDPHQLLRFAELVEQEERARCLVWVKEVEDVLRYAVSKISYTLSRKEESRND